MSEADIERLRAEFPHWYVWRGVLGLLYARWPKSSPPKVTRAGNVAELRERMIDLEAAR